MSFRGELFSGNVSPGRNHLMRSEDQLSELCGRFTQVMTSLSVQTANRVESVVSLTLSGLKSEHLQEQIIRINE